MWTLTTSEGGEGERSRCSQLGWWLVPQLPAAWKKTSQDRQKMQSTICSKIKTFHSGLIQQFCWFVFWISLLLAIVAQDHGFLVLNWHAEIVGGHDINAKDCVIMERHMFLCQVTPRILFQKTFKSSSQSSDWQCETTHLWYQTVHIKS